jgi:UDPglucose 6-dehydrogenase
MDRCRREHPDLAIGLCEDAILLFENADAVVLITEWAAYGELDWPALKSRMHTPLVIDGRGSLDCKLLAEAGYRVVSIP